jgi:hypothetical protein
LRRRAPSTNDFNRPEFLSSHLTERGEGSWSCLKSKTGAQISRYYVVRKRKDAQPFNGILFDNTLTIEKKSHMVSYMLRPHLLVQESICYPFGQLKLVRHVVRPRKTRHQATLTAIAVPTFGICLEYTSYQPPTRFERVELDRLETEGRYGALLPICLASLRPSCTYRDVQPCRQQILDSLRRQMEV